MYRNDSIGQNMLHVNDIMVRGFKLALVAIAVIVILKASGIIALAWLNLIIIVGISSISCTLPILCRHFSMDGRVIKNVNVYCSAILCTLFYCCLDTRVIILPAIPIVFSCLYFDIKLTGYSSALSVVGLLLREVLRNGFNWSFALAIPLLQFPIGTALLITVAKRALYVISNTHSHYENINNIFSNIHASSQNLETAEDILLKGVSVLSAGNDEEASASDDTVKGIISNINKSMENTREIIKYTQTMFKGKSKDFKAEDGIAKIEEYTKTSSQLVLKLSKYTEKINEDLNLISMMIDEGKLLSINAVSEAENASSGGRGSTIIAMKVEKLADESVESATHIQELLNNVVSDAENTMKSVAEIYEEIFKSLELINRTVETLIKWLMYKNMK